MKTASFIAAVLLVSCARVSAPEASPLMRTVPSRAVEVMHFPHLEQALELLFDSTSVFRSIDYGRLDDAEMVLSYDYSAGLIPLLAIDAGRSAADTSSAARKVLEQAAGLKLYALHTGDLLPKRAAILLSPSQAAVDEAFRHIESKVSILDANGFADALSLAGGSAGAVILKNENAGRWLPRNIPPGRFSRRDLTRFLTGAAEWTVLGFDSYSREGIKVKCLGNGNRKYLCEMFAALPEADCKVGSVLPAGASFVLGMPLKDAGEYLSAWQDCLDRRAELSKYRGRLAGLKKAAGKSPEVWFKEISPKEVALVQWDAYELLLLRPAKKVRNSGIGENPRAGFIPALLGDAFRLADDSRSAAQGGWIAFGSEEALGAWLAAEKPESAAELPRKAKFYFANDGISLCADTKYIVLNVN